MVKIYQWELSRYYGNEFRLEGKEVEAKETPKGYKATTGTFINYKKSLSKDCMDSILVAFDNSPIYSSFDNNVELALVKLKEWYSDYVNNQIAKHEHEVEVLKKRLSIVKGIELDTDGGNNG